LSGLGKAIPNEKADRYFHSLSKHNLAPFSITEGDGITLPLLPTILPELTPFGQQREYEQMK